MVFIVIIILFIIAFLHFKKQQNKRFFRVKKQSKTSVCTLSIYNRPKPEWVKAKVIYLKAILGQGAGCRYVAQNFNRLYGNDETVGKTYVANIIAKHQYEIQVERRKIKNKLPRWVAANCTWHVQQLRSTLLGQWI